MEDHLPWLRQGNVFADIPVVVFADVDDALGDVTFARVDHGLALLITDNCQMDKRTSKAGAPKIRRLQFAPLRPIEPLGHDRITRLRNLEISPPEAVYVGTPSGTDEETYASLSEVYTLPASYFDPRIESFEGHEAEDPSESNHDHVVPGATDCRIGTLDADQRNAMREKMRAFWLGQIRTFEDPRPPGIS